MRRELYGTRTKQQKKNCSLFLQNMSARATKQIIICHIMKLLFCNNHMLIKFPLITQPPLSSSLNFCQKYIGFWTWPFFFRLQKKNKKQFFFNNSWQDYFKFHWIIKRGVLCFYVPFWQILRGKHLPIQQYFMSRSILSCLRVFEKEIDLKVRHNNTEKLFW